VLAAGATYANAMQSNCATSMPMLHQSGPSGAKTSMALSTASSQLIAKNTQAKLHD